MKTMKKKNLLALVSAFFLAGSMQAQNQYLVSQLGCKAPVPAFNVPAPWQYGNYGCNSGCSGCGNY